MGDMAELHAYQLGEKVKVMQERIDELEKALREILDLDEGADSWWLDRERYEKVLGEL